MIRNMDDKDMDIIRRYFDYDLNESELETFQHRLENDASFSKEVDDYETAYNTVDEWILSNRKDISSGQQQRSNDKPTTSNPMKWMLLLLGIIAISSVAYFMFQGQGNTSDKELIFAEVQRYTDMMSDDLLRGDGATHVTDEEARLQEIIKAYNPDESNATLKALNEFISNSQNPNFKEIASWWIINIHLEKGKMTEAKDILKAISDSPEFNSSKKAKDFLKKLN